MRSSPFRNNCIRKFSTKHNFEGRTTHINFGCFVMVSEKYAILIHRFQKFNRLMKPGLNFKIPFVDSIEYIHDLREQVIEI